MNHRITENKRGRNIELRRIHWTLAIKQDKHSAKAWKIEHGRLQWQHQIKSIQFTGLNNSTCAQKKTFTLEKWVGCCQTMSGKMEHQLASKRSLKLDTVGASAMCGGSLFHGPAERTGKPLSAWQGENVVDGPWSCALGGHQQLAVQRTPPQTSSGDCGTACTPWWE